jgi:hypothetical protein
MEVNGMKIEERTGHMEDNIDSSYNIKRKRFLKRMMWAKVFMRIKIDLILSYHS